MVVVAAPINQAVVKSRPLSVGRNSDCMNSQPGKARLARATNNAVISMATRMVCSRILNAFEQCVIPGCGDSGERLGLALSGAHALEVGSKRAHHYGVVAGVEAGCIAYIKTHRVIIGCPQQEAATCGQVVNVVRIPVEHSASRRDVGFDDGQDITGYLAPIGRSRYIVAYGLADIKGSDRREIFNTF